MELLGRNMWAVREELGIRSIGQKIEKRVLQPIGHVLRMPNSRDCKRMVLGWYPDSRRDRRTAVQRQSTLDYWRGVLRRAGIDPDEAEEATRDRKAWRRRIHDRIRHIEQW